VKLAEDELAALPATPFRQHPLDLRLANFIDDVQPRERWQRMPLRLQRFRGAIGTVRAT